MTKDELLKLEPATLVNVTINGVFAGVRKWSHMTACGHAVVQEDGDYPVARSFLAPENISLHIPQTQVSGTIETPPKLYTLRFGHGIPATDEQIMAQECVKNLSESFATDWNWLKDKTYDIEERLAEAQNTERILNEEIAKRNETIHNLRMRLEQLEAPPTTDEVEHAYNTLIVAGYKNEASVLRTLSHVVERLSERLEELEQLPDVENN